MTDNVQIDLITLSQAIIAAHQASDARQEKLLSEWPRLFTSQAQHVDLERRVHAVELAVERITDKLTDLPERIYAKIEMQLQQQGQQQHNQQSIGISKRQFYLAILLFVIGELITITLFVGSILLHH